MIILAAVSPSWKSHISTVHPPEKKVEWHFKTTPKTTPISRTQVQKPFIQYNTTNVQVNWQASQASETLSGVYKFELMRYVYIYMYGGTCAIIVAHATYT